MNEITYNITGMKHSTRNLIALAGVIFAVVGGILAIPFFLKEQYLPAVISVVSVILGLVLLAIAFGE